MKLGVNYSVYVRIYITQRRIPLRTFHWSSSHLYFHFRIEELCIFPACFAVLQSHMHLQETLEYR